MTTIFERIIAGELSASFVHQDARCVAFMDINPVTRGHVLVVPRRAVATLDQLDALTRAHLWETANRIGRAQRQGLGSRAQHLLVNDGKAASQTVPHVHIHVIPRYGSDTLHTLARLAWHITTITIPRRETPERRGKLEAAAAEIRSAL
ncbi:HIT family protein [Solimonas sp. SE-A11]|uniref:HIT family protein n=1 Tax=Solimonas sp. SE-A11 TaxID=3054954 RepID=UPI00259C70ED|nr:HIT family protein [Solimonas sp. SE-A11]MDM4768933.1 HIT family protein [Solimonas sp. SE-A11]